MSKIEEDLIADLKEELEEDNPEKFNLTLLTSKVKSVVREVKQARRYPQYYSEEKVNEDMYRYYTQCRLLSLYDYNKVGVDFASSNTESGNNTQYINRKQLFSGIYPIARSNSW